MQLIEVTNAALAKEFIQVNVELNKANPAYIRPIDKEIEEVFDPERNKAFRHGEVARWILKRRGWRFDRAHCRLCQQAI
jgi:hypothetical protein